MVQTFTETRNNNSLVSKYHPNFWMDGRWRCCSQLEKLAGGCAPYDPTKNGKTWGKRQRGNHLSLPSTGCQRPKAKFSNSRIFTGAPVSTISFMLFRVKTHAPEVWSLVNHLCYLGANYKYLKKKRKRKPTLVLPNLLDQSVHVNKICAALVDNSKIWEVLQLGNLDSPLRS